MLPTLSCHQLQNHQQHLIIQLTQVAHLMIHFGRTGETVLLEQAAARPQMARKELSKLDEVWLALWSVAWASTAWTKSLCTSWDHLVSSNVVCLCTVHRILDQSDCLFGTGSGPIQWNNCRMAVAVAALTSLTMSLQQSTDLQLPQWPKTATKRRKQILLGVNIEQLFILGHRCLFFLFEVLPPGNMGSRSSAAVADGCKGCYDRNSKSHDFR